MSIKDSENILLINSFTSRAIEEDSFKTKVTVDITSDHKQRESDLNSLFKEQIQRYHKIGEFTTDAINGYSFRAIGGKPRATT